MKTSLEVRTHLVELFRRDLIGPHPDLDHDLATERLSGRQGAGDNRPSRWYLAGFLAPAEDGITAAKSDSDDGDQPDMFGEAEIEGDEVDPAGAGGAAPDQDEPEAPVARKRFLPSSIGLTVMLPLDVTELEARVTWGDYKTEPPLPDSVLIGDYEPEIIGEDGKPVRRKRAEPVDWVRAPRESKLLITVPIESPRGQAQLVPDSKALQGSRSGGLTIDTHARVLRIPLPDGTTQHVRILTVFLVNRRQPINNRPYADVSYVFQARLELTCEAGFRPRYDLSGYNSPDLDLRIGDLHYRDVQEFAVGKNSAAGWKNDEDGQVRCVFTNPLPTAEVERVAPNVDEALTKSVTFSMRDLAALCGDSSALQSALAGLPDQYADWIKRQQPLATKLDSPRRKEVADLLTNDMISALVRMRDGIQILGTNEHARNAFRFMNKAVGDAAMKREPSQTDPTWRPFQLAFILLNLSGLTDKAHPDREVADLLFFPTGGGKTEAYLGLAAYTIALRRITGPGLLGAGVSVIMRYTLRLLTLDQLSRAAGVICALELMREDPANIDGKGRRLLGDQPIEIGLWVGSDASPNKLGGKGKNDENSAVVRVDRFTSGRNKSTPAPIKACPWCGIAFSKRSFRCTPNKIAPRNLEIFCDDPSCAFGGSKSLPILTVDEPIYRRLPAFLIATVDKFASLPWEGDAGAFFGHVDRYRGDGEFCGASNPTEGTPLGNGHSLDPPDLIIQDELHLISGPLGTVAGLYETAIDFLASRQKGDLLIRPKIVASTATVRRASEQMCALFDRNRTAIFPPSGLDRSDSFFARALPTSQENPGRLYLGIAAQGRGPKLVFLRALAALLSGAQAAFESSPSGPEVADPYMTALCYFNALRELGGARRIVEDEVTKLVSRYGTDRRRADPPDVPFADRKVVEPMELTSRVSTDQVAEAKKRLEQVFLGKADTIDVALATNMISVGLDITRLGLMLVQGQPKTAAEYIQATSRVGRDQRKPGLVTVVLNLHKPRDRMHYEQFSHFHRTFYRAVEATSVTPWAARALDRALAAVVVAAIRHSDRDLTPEVAAKEIAAYGHVRNAVSQAILRRAKGTTILGANPVSLLSQIDQLMDVWTSVAAELSSNGGNFRYGRGPQRLLHLPLSPEIPNLEPGHRLFQAGRSMRDVEPSVNLKIRDPFGAQIANTDGN